MSEFAFDKLQAAEFALFEARNAMHEDGYSRATDDIEVMRERIEQLMKLYLGAINN